MMYKYRVYSTPDEFVEHSDPYGFGMELRPGSASIIRELDEFKFTDDEWMAKRDVGYNNPVIYMNFILLHGGKKRTVHGTLILKPEKCWFHI